MIHRAKDFRSRLHEWLKDGLPFDLMGDPASDKRASELSKLILALDKKSLSKMSNKSREELLKTFLRATKSINSFEVDVNDEY
jgi:hypothetical protein